MKIIHVHSLNLSIFEEAVKGTGCYINGSTDPITVLKTLQMYNVRDVFGLIVFRKHLTRKCLKLIGEFDSLFEFNPKPIIVICDDASELVKEKKLRVKNSPLYVIDSIGGTLSDIDINKAFVTLCCIADNLYDFDVIDSAIPRQAVGEQATVNTVSVLARALQEEYLELERRCCHAD